MAFLERAIHALPLSARDDRVINSLVQEGVYELNAAGYQVTASSPASMTLVVGSGTIGDKAAIQGDTNVGVQGVYLALNTEATSTVVIPAADATHPRLDKVVLRVQDDNEDSGGVNSVSLEVVEGTAQASPVAPPTPASSLLLATVTVSAGATSIAKASLQDDRVQAILQPDLLTSYTVKYGLSADVTVSNNSTTDLVWATEYFKNDPLTIFSQSGQTVTINRTGLYDIRAGVLWASNSTGRRIITLVKSGVNLSRNDLSAADSAGRSPIVSAVTRLTSGDTIKLAVFQNSGGDLAVQDNGELDFLSLRYLGDI